MVPWVHEILPPAKRHLGQIGFFSGLTNVINTQIDGITIVRLVYCKLLGFKLFTKFTVNGG